MHLDFEGAHRFPDHIIEAYHSGLLGLLAMSIGFFVTTRYLKTPDAEGVIWQMADRLNGRKLVVAYCIIFFCGNILLGFAGGLRQLVIAALGFKWALFFVLYYKYFQTGKNRKLFAALFILEVLIGFTGFFSSYKSAFFVVILAFYAFNPAISNARFLAIASMVIVLFCFSAFWQSIKGDYRSYLNNESGSQTVTTTKTESLSEIGRLVKNYNISDADNSISVLVERLSYIDIYSAVIANIPANREHERGRLWFDASLRAFQPRILFPNKTIADDSEKTNMYTGLFFSGSDSNTSISMGYIAETYIDFGFKGMLIFLLFFGCFIGYIYHRVRTGSTYPFLGMVMLVPLFFCINSFETALDKLVPAIFLYVIAWWLINRYIAANIERFFSK